MKANAPVEIDMKSLWNHPLELSLCILLVGIVLITFTQVMFRYVFQLSLGWTEELARFFFMWIAALSVGYAFKTKSHFALNFIVDRLGLRIRQIVLTLGRLIMTVFLVLFIWKAIEYTFSASDQYGPSTGLSMAVPYSSTIFAGVLMLFYIIKNWYEEVFKNSSVKKAK